MKIYTKHITLNRRENMSIHAELEALLTVGEQIIKFVIVKSTKEKFFCEIDILKYSSNSANYSDNLNKKSIFKNYTRKYYNNNQFTAVLLIPTGIGAEIGGHCGDGNVISRLIAESCDTLITHPNVVNAADINELPHNGLYVEGSIITRLLTGSIGLQKVSSNRILLIMDKHEDSSINAEIVNAVQSARISLGISCDIIQLSNSFKSVFKWTKSGRSSGEIYDIERLFNVIREKQPNYDAIALSTYLNIPEEFDKEYFEDNTTLNVNPWGGIEAMITHSVSETFNMPTAHAPILSGRKELMLNFDIVDPRKAAETSSISFLYCVLKGLHKAPRVVLSNKGITVEDISCLIVPDGCVGLPVLSCKSQGIPIIAVRENTNIMKNDLSLLDIRKDKLIIVDTYLEAIGVINALKAGISLDTIRRPINKSTVIKI